MQKLTILSVALLSNLSESADLSRCRKNEQAQIDADNICTLAKEIIKKHEEGQNECIVCVKGKNGCLKTGNIDITGRVSPHSIDDDMFRPFLEHCNPLIAKFNTLVGRFKDVYTKQTIGNRNVLERILREMQVDVIDKLKKVLTTIPYPVEPIGALGVTNITQH